MVNTASSPLSRIGAAALLALCSLGVSVSPAWTQSKFAPVRLAYDVAEDAEDCPDAAMFRAGIAGRVAADPFAGDATIDLHVRVEKSEQGYAVSIAMTSEGERLGSRTLTSESCSTVVRAAELAVVLMLPSGAFQSEASAPTASQVLPTRRSETVEATTSREPESERPVRAEAPQEPGVPISAEVLAKIGGSIGILPAASESFSVGTLVRRGNWSLGGEASWHRSAATTLAAGDVLASLVSGALVPCRHYGAFGVCGIASAGLMLSEGRNHTMDMEASTPYAAIGTRLTWEYDLSKRLSIRSSVDLTGTLVRARLRVLGAPTRAWTAPLAATAFGISISSRL